jgi:hypothetical protein
VLPRSYPRAMAEKASRLLLEARAVEAPSPAALTAVLEAAFAEEVLLEQRLREEAEAVLQANKALVRTGGADLHVLREKIMAKLAQDRGRILR